MKNLKASLFFIPIFSLTCIVLTPLLRSQDYFPLRIGNKWVYEIGGWPGFEVDEITDTTRINDNLYYLLRETHFQYAYNDTFVNYYCYRQDSLKQIWYANKDTREEYLTFVRFNIRPGLIVSKYDSMNQLTYTSYLLDTAAIYTTPAGKFTNCYLFESWIEEINTNFFHYYAPDIGRIFNSSEGQDYTLQGALINNVLIGDTTITGIGNEIQHQQPVSFELFQNYPNPFNQSTTISYQLTDSRPTEVTLKIYNLAGKEVMLLFKGFQTKGLHTIKWNGSDTHGNELSSGIYFSELSYSGFNKVRKLLLIK